MTKCEDPMKRRNKKRGREKIDD